MTGIYQIISPTGEVYIGQTFDLMDRIRTHKYQHNKKQSLLYNSCVKYGFYSHKITMLHELPSDVHRSVMITYEQFYINQHIEAGTKMLNQSATAQYGFSKGYTPWNKGNKKEKTTEDLNRLNSRRRFLWAAKKGKN